jgi:2-polyprenyl-3-methyl-5-hydroxy-6-metoxy-1,4-benzoquinol methylase
MSSTISTIPTEEDSIQEDLSSHHHLSLFSSLDFNSLLSFWKTVPIGYLSNSPNSYPQYKYSGQIYARRIVHRTLLFVSLCLDGSQGNVSCVEVLIRQDVVGETEMKTLLYTLRLGDVWQVTGALENPGKISSSSQKPLLVATKLILIKKWPQEFIPYSRFTDPPLPSLMSMQNKNTKDEEDRNDRGKEEEGGEDYDDDEEEEEEEIKDITVSGDTCCHCQHQITNDSSKRQSIKKKNDSIEKEWYKGIPLHRLCRRFISSQQCHTRNCIKLHSLEEEVVPIDNTTSLPTFSEVIFAWEKWRIRDRTLRLPLHTDDSVGKTNIHDRLGHSQRASVFSLWILRSIPKELLTRGVILDVAGGKGEVAKILANNGCTVITVDPRIPKKVKKSLYREKQTPTCHVEESINLAGGSHSYIFEMFDQAFEQKHVELLSRVSLILGFHPDEATEPIVDWSIKTNIPIIIVPCCVFSRVFPNRRLFTGKEVTSFDDFIQYLKEKFQLVKRLKIDFLEYLGANQVLYNLYE